MNFEIPPKPRLHFVRDRNEYSRIHKWVYRTLGRADHCSVDAAHQSGRFHWSNVSRQYKKDISDWQQLCPTCHHRRDGVHPEVRAIMRLRSRGNSSHNTPVVAIHTGTGALLNFVSLTQATNELGILCTSISNCLNGRSNSAGGYYWHYAKARVTT